MRKVIAYILLTVFTLFLGSTAVDFGRYVEMLNAGAGTEDVTSIPEEQHEDASKIKDHLTASGVVFPASATVDRDFNDLHSFSLSENIYFDVPHSPPDLL